MTQPSLGMPKHPSIPRNTTFELIPSNGMHVMSPAHEGTPWVYLTIEKDGDGTSIRGTISGTFEKDYIGKPFDMSITTCNPFDYQVWELKLMGVTINELFQPGPSGHEFCASGLRGWQPWGKVTKPIKLDLHPIKERLKVNSPTNWCRDVDALIREVEYLREQLKDQD